MGIGLLAGNVIGLVNIWAVQSRMNWMLRAGVVVGSIAIPVLIAGWDLVFLFLIQSVVFLTLAILLDRPMATRASKAFVTAKQQFREPVDCNAPSLITFIAFLACVAVPVFLLFCMPLELWKTWRYLVVIGVGFGFATFLAYWAVFFAKSNISCLWAAVLLPVAAPMIVFLSILRAAHNSCKGYHEACSEESEKVPTVRRYWLRLMPAAAMIFAVAICAPPIILFLVVMPRVWSLPAITVNAKGYGFLIAEGKKLQDVVPSDSSADTVALRAFVLKHRGVLDAVRDKLCDFEEASPPQLMYDAGIKVNSLRQLQKAFLAQETVAEREKRTVDAAEICLDMVRLGQTVAKGGDVFDLLLGTTIESAGLQRLYGLADHLSVEERRRFARMFYDVIEHQEPLERVIERDLGWGTHPFVWRGYAVDTILGMTLYEPPRLRNLRDHYYISRAKQHMVAQRLLTGGKAGQ